MVFQIVDDILDVTATDEQLGKPAGHDMVEGVYTLPVIRTMASGEPAADELFALLGSPLDDRQKGTALSIVRANHGVGAAVDTAQEYVRRACDALADFPDTPAVTALREAPMALLAGASVNA